MPDQNDHPHINFPLSFRQEHYRRLLAQHGVLNASCAVLSLIVSVASFVGLRDIIGGDGWAALVVPFTIASGSGVLFWLFWHRLFTSLPLMDSRGRRRQLITLATVLVLVQMLFSAWPVSTAITGHSATSAHLAESAAQDRVVLLKVDKAVLAQSVLIGAVTNKASQYRAQGQLEVKGIFSGTLGDGVVAESFSATADSLDKAAGQMRKTVDQAGALHDQGLDLLRQMDQIVAEE